jgi:DNA-binding IclR family transcriptional regulator
MKHAPGLPRNQSLERTVLLLRTLAAHPEGATIATLARETALARPTTGRLLATLADAGLAEQPSAGDGWVLGYELVRLGRAADPYRGLIQRAQPYLERLAEEAGESAMLGASRHAGTLDLISQVDAGTLVGIGNWVGRSFGLHASAGGKLVYAALEDAELDALLRDAGLERYTERTLASHDALHAEIQRVRRQGYAESIDELEHGLSSIGVPVEPVVRGVALSVGVSGPTSRLTARRRREILPRIRACAKRLGELET